ncbi:pseudouridine-5'-phosphate glycosidase [Mesobacillus jeotgali]|uniref:pseudouridine-5'-phosphate glycosidase n=1 Tax=Mesobacillus jeotgali TaxID=129985 RepID=UPI001C57F80B|nr:pseudouridine-5'-phosphate glycosidase [Mesobacillus jeotgali]
MNTLARVSGNPGIPLAGFGTDSLPAFIPGLAKGKSLVANIALVKNNGSAGAKIAASLS